VAGFTGIVKPLLEATLRYGIALPADHRAAAHFRSALPPLELVRLLAARGFVPLDRLHERAVLAGVPDPYPAAVAESVYEAISPRALSAFTDGSEADRAWLARKLRYFGLSPDDTDKGVRALELKATQPGRSAVITQLLAGYEKGHLPRADVVTGLDPGREGEGARQRPVPAPGRAPGVAGVPGGRPGDGVQRGRAPERRRAGAAPRAAADDGRPARHRPRRVPRGANPDCRPSHRGGHGEARQPPRRPAGPRDPRAPDRPGVSPRGRGRGHRGPGAVRRRLRVAEGVGAGGRVRRGRRAGRRRPGEDQGPRRAGAGDSGRAPPPATHAGHGGGAHSRPSGALPDLGNAGDREPAERPPT